MMKPLSRRNFLRFAPVSVGAIALGMAVMPTAETVVYKNGVLQTLSTDWSGVPYTITWLDHLEGETVTVFVERPRKTIRSFEFAGGLSD